MKEINKLSSEDILNNFKDMEKFYLTKEEKRIFGNGDPFFCAIFYIKSNKIL